MKLYVLSALCAIAFAGVAFADGDSIEGNSSFHEQTTTNGVLLVCKNAKTGEVVGEPKISNPNWHFAGADSGCPKCNSDWCNQNVAECEGNQCTTVATPVAGDFEDPNKIGIEDNLGFDN